MFGLATVVRTFRSAPREPGAAMAVSAEGEVDRQRVRRLRRGCRVRGGPGGLRDRAGRCCETYGVSDDDALAVGLTCGGILHVFVEPVSARVLPRAGRGDGGDPGGRAGRGGHRHRGPGPGRRAPGDLGRRGPRQRHPGRRGPAGPGGGRRRARHAGPGPDRGPPLRRARRAARRRTGRLRALVRAAAADAGVRRHRLRRGRGPGGQVPRLPGHRVRRAAASSPPRPGSPTPTRWWSTGRTGTWPGPRWTRAR